MTLDLHGVPSLDQLAEHPERACGLSRDVILALHARAVGVVMVAANFVDAIFSPTKAGLVLLNDVDIFRTLSPMDTFWTPSHRIDQAGLSKYLISLTREWRNWQTRKTQERAPSSATVGDTRP